MMLSRKIEIIGGFIIIGLLMFAVFYSYVFLWSKEGQIRQKIGEFSIEERVAYQGGTIIKVLRQSQGAGQSAFFFFKGGRLQRLPEDYVLGLAKSRLTDTENNRPLSIKFQEAYDSGTQNEQGEKLVYRDVFFVSQELPDAAQVKSAMYPGGEAKYQVFVIDEFGQALFKFISGENF